MTDPIADYLTRLRNAISAKHRVVEVPASNLKKEITKILFEKGYILNYKFVEDGPQGTIKVALKYDSVNFVNRIILQGNLYSTLRTIFYKLVIKNVAFFKKNLSDFFFQI